MELTEEKIVAVIREVMQSWRLYQPEAACLAVELKPSGWCLGYQADMAFWTANILGSTFYLLSSAINSQLRGHGHGARLYELREEIARRLGCTRIQLHPSGWCMKPDGTRGETRKNYLLRRGWLPTGNVEVYKDIPQLETATT